MSRWSDRAAARLVTRPSRTIWSPALWAAIVLAVLLAIAAAAIWSVVEHRDESALAPAQPASRAAARVAIDSSGETVITLSAAVQQKNGIETAVPKAVAYEGRIRAYGTVLDLAGLITLGNSYATAKAQLEIAEAKLAASKAAFTRAQTLYRNQQNVSQAEVQTTEATFRADQAGVAMAESQLRTLAATALQEWGAVLGKELADGGPLIGLLVARQDFLVELSLPPARSLPERWPAAAMLELPSGARLPIRFVSPAPRADPKIQGLSLLYVVAAGNGALPGMEVVGLLPDGNVAQAVIVSPAAIVWWQGRAWAYVREGAERFVRREVPTALPAPDESGGYVVRDLAPTAEIVTRGAQALLSEEFRAQIDVGN
jgi:hypothetical protein